MKASVVGLFVATAAFGSSSIYLWSQLQDERTRAEEFAIRSAELNARIAELEAARAQFGERRFAGANTFDGRPATAGPGKPPPPPNGASEDNANEIKPSPWSVRPSPERTAAMQKMMRPQIRANNKRMYADIGSALGLSKEQANKLIDLLTDQQVTQFGQQREFDDPNEARNNWEEIQRQQKADLSDLIGADKVASLEEYQKSLPARQELDMLARQFDGYDVPLNEDQRKRLLTVMVEERDRVPSPTFTEGGDMEEFQKIQMAWEEDYNERVASQARSILDSTQANALNEYQQAQKDMRSQFVTMMPPGGPRRMMRGVAGGNVMFTSAAPAGAVVHAESVTLVAPASAPDKK
jgi:hypothetical protein